MYTYVALMIKVVYLCPMTLMLCMQELMKDYLRNNTISSWFYHVFVVLKDVTVMLDLNPTNVA
jgi:hypothetical protein